MLAKLNFEPPRELFQIRLPQPASRCMLNAMESAITIPVALIEAAIPNVQGIWLFGSAAAGTLRADSDIDLAILAAEPMGKIDQLTLKQALEDATGRAIDLIDLGDPDLSTILKYEAVTRGLQIADLDPRVTGSHVIQIQLDYVDLMEDRREIDAAIQLRGSVHAA
jgi:uncharacterized protein